MAVSPAVPGLFFCFIAMVLLVFVRVQSNFSQTRVISYPTYFPGIRIRANLE